MEMHNQFLQQPPCCLAREPTEAAPCFSFASRNSRERERARLGHCYTPRCLNTHFLCTYRHAHARAGVRILVEGVVSE